jgi:hypothetical protein
MEITLKIVWSTILRFIGILLTIAGGGVTFFGLYAGSQTPGFYLTREFPMEAIVVIATGIAILGVGAAMMFYSTSGSSATGEYKY